ncbi:MAG: hypothetical protein ACTSRF_05470 [Candidatus Freyarchaeota archaeon]
MRVKIEGKTVNVRNVWMEGKTIHMIDQTRLPFEFRIHKTNSYAETVQAIREMRIRGAPAIGVAASYGLAQAAQDFKNFDSKKFWKHMEAAKRELLNTRPTAVDLHNMVGRMWTKMTQAETPRQCAETAVSESQRIAEENADACRGC